MSTALQVEKVNKREGRIIHENDASKNFSSRILIQLIFPFLEDEPTITEMLKNPTKVVLLKVHT